MTGPDDDPDIETLAVARREEVLATNQRRLLALTGDRDADTDAAFDTVHGVDVLDDEVAFVTTREGFRLRRAEPKHVSSLLGATRTLVVLGAHEEFSANALGRAVGVVDGGDLLVLLTPLLDDWSTRHDSFNERLAVPPFLVADMTSRFHDRLVSTLQDHPGVALVDLGSGTVERDGAHRQGISFDAAPSRVPTRKGRRSPRRAYEDYLAVDQSEALATLEALMEPGIAVVVEADHGRGKSSVVGLAARSLVAKGGDVVMTASGERNTAKVSARAERLLFELGALCGGDTGDFDIATDRGGRIRYVPPTGIGDAAADADTLVMDETAALPVGLLELFFAVPAITFHTAIRGYKGAGRGSTVRFHDCLDDADRETTDAYLSGPTCYTADDPVESWMLRVLLSDACPSIDRLVADATPGIVSYRTFSPDDLLADEYPLREASGLLILAHYQTEPDDFAYLLDAPNLTLRVLTHKGQVVSVMLLARKGGLDLDTRRQMCDGGRIHGNMLLGTSTSQLRDEGTDVPVGYRVMRIITHHVAQLSGLGSWLLTELRDEFADSADYLGVGFGATPELLSL